MNKPQKPTNLGNDEDTVEIPAPHRSSSLPPRPFSALVQADVAGVSHQGLVRTNNEDHFVICRFGRSLQILQSNLDDASPQSQFEETGFGLVVADGMGGNAAGELASGRAIQILLSLVINTPDWILRPEGEQQVEEVLRRSVERYQAINENLAQQAAEAPKLRGFGTTMTVAASVGADLFLAHIGDSRAYIFRQGKLLRLTRDHTVAQRLADEGRIRQEEVATHRLRHVLTACLGDYAHNVHPDVRKLTLENGDLLMLCTDGLTDLIADDDIATCLSSGESKQVAAQEACQSLVYKALEAGGHDNITVVAARYTFPAA